MLPRLVRRVTSNTRILLVVVLTAALVITVAGYAIGRGLGATSVPSGDVAVVDDVPDGGITSDEFQKTLEQTAARQGIKQVPKPSDPSYPTLRDSAMADALLSRWVRGEADERGITVSDSEVSDQLEKIKKQQFGSEKKFQQFLKQAGFSLQDARERVELQLLSTEIQKQVLPTAPNVSQSQIENFYEANKTQFTQPAVDAAIFTAPAGQLVGPIEGQTADYLIEVEKVNPEKVTSLSDATSQIKQQLSQGIQQEAATAFQQDFVDKWTSRTLCASGYVMDRCANFTPTDACNGDDSGEQGDVDKTGCPAPVASMAPVAPGAGGLFPGQPAQGLPQGPIQPPSAQPGVIGPPGAPTLPPGVAPQGAPPATPQPGTAPPQGAPPAPPP